MNDRKPWSHYFLDIAEQVSSRSTCDRKHVGCVLVIDKRIVATGYNGSIKGEPHCDDVGHDLVDTMGSDGKLAPNCVRTVHAEANALAQAARFGVRLDKAIAYVNTYPCWPCFRLMANAGITSVIFRDGYRIDQRVHDASARLGIRIEGPGCIVCGDVQHEDIVDGKPYCPNHYPRSIVGALGTLDGEAHPRDVTNEVLDDAEKYELENMHKVEDRFPFNGRYLLSMIREIRRRRGERKHIGAMGVSISCDIVDRHIQRLQGYLGDANDRVDVLEREKQIGVTEHGDKVFAVPPKREPWVPEIGDRVLYGVNHGVIRQLARPMPARAEVVFQDGSSITTEISDLTPED